MTDACKLLAGEHQDAVHGFWRSTIVVEGGKTQKHPNSMREGLLAIITTERDEELSGRQKTILRKPTKINERWTRNEKIAFLIKLFFTF
jgi:hypothetical protein